MSREARGFSGKFAADCEITATELGNCARKKWDPFRCDKIATKCKCRLSKELNEMLEERNGKWAATKLEEEKGRMQKAESRTRHPLTSPRRVACGDPALSPEERENARRTGRASGTPRKAEGGGQNSRVGSRLASSIPHSPFRSAPSPRPSLRRRGRRGEHWQSRWHTKESGRQ